MLDAGARLHMTVLSPGRKALDWPDPSEKKKRTRKERVGEEKREREEKRREERETREQEKDISRVGVWNAQLAVSPFRTVRRVVPLQKFNFHCQDEHLFFVLSSIPGFEGYFARMQACLVGSSEMRPKSHH